MFVGKARGLPYSGAHERCFTWVGSCLTCKHYTILERLARDEHYSLLQIFVNCDRKILLNIGPRLLKGHYDTTYNDFTFNDFTYNDKT
jgi:hypothetical protein